MADQPSPTSLQPLLSEAARQAERWATAQRIAAERPDLDVWLGRIDSVALHEAARRAGGFYNVGFGMHPPMLGGEGLDRLDLVVTAQGLRPFADEYVAALTADLDGLTARVLPLDRVIASKRAARRPKDLAQVPLLEAALAAKTERRGEPCGFRGRASVAGRPTRPRRGPSHRLPPPLLIVEARR